MLVLQSNNQIFTFHSIFRIVDIDHLDLFPFFHVESHCTYATFEN